MLTIQPTKTAFEGGKSRLTPEEIEAIREEREYQKNYDELADQRDEFIDLAKNDEFKVPNAAKKVIEGGAIITTGLLGGMASGWGAKKTIQGFSKLNKTQAMKNLKLHASASKNFIKESIKDVKAKFIASDAYKMPANYLKRQFVKFNNTKIGKPIVEFFSNVAKGIKSVLKEIKKGIKYIYKKITGIDKATAEKVTVNTVGVSGGIASGVTALKNGESAENDVD